MNPTSPPSSPPPSDPPSGIRARGEAALDRRALFSAFAATQLAPASMRKRGRVMGLAPDVVKDLTQIALVELWEKGESVPPASWPAWMTTALRLRLWQWQRSFRLRARYEPQIALAFEELGASVAPEEAAYQRECAREVEELIGHVPGERQPVGAPDNWNGACSSQATLAAGLECNGGEPCAQSMVVAAPELAAAPCGPETSGEPVKSDPAWTWETIALGCTEKIPETADYCNSGEVAMRDRSSDGFLICTEAQGEVCPRLVETSLGGEIIRFTFYGDAEDTRTCSPCECDSPEGNACSVKVSAYTDPGCVNEAGSAVVTSNGGAACFDVPDGTALAGKRAELVETTPGSCAPSGGDVVGEVQPTKPIRFCCEKYD